MAFQIHSRLLRSGIKLADISRCHILLKKEASFPWFIVVPEVEEPVEDLHHLPPEQFHEVMAVIRLTSRFAEHFFKPEKLNVACIGNQVRQMHIHIIARTTEDQAWPGVVWGADFQKRPYPEEQLDHIVDSFREYLYSTHPDSLPAKPSSRESTP